jgi:hypothetical protein
MKQCPKCLWKRYCYTDPICDKARQMLHNTDIANEIFKRYKKLDCLYFIDRKEKETTYTTIEAGQVNHFQDLMNKYLKLGCSKRVLNITKKLKRETPLFPD